MYAISKNEEQFVERFMKTAKEADKVFVLDTGSTDNTVSKLKKLGAIVKEKEIKPWRFDVARNESLKMVPDDFNICVCLDLDEVIMPGWRKKLEKLWDKNTTRLRYNYNWQLDENDKPIINFYIEKIHLRKNYKWTHPVHEVLTYENKNEVIKTTNEITVNHYPDNTKSRQSYLPLLELSVKEDPEDDRNMHYLGREYMYYQKWNECIDTLIKHLNLKSATWKDERCASMRFIARSYINLKRYDEAKMWLDKAMKEAPYLRDPFMERAFLEYRLNNWNEVVNYCNKALDIKTHTKTYINESFSWDYSPYDLLSVAYFNKQQYDLSLFYVNKALDMDKDNERLKENKEIILKSLKTVN